MQESSQEFRGSDYSSVFGTYETAPGVLSLVLGSQVQKNPHQHTRVTPTEVISVVQGLKHTTYGGKVREMSSFSLKRKLRRQPCCCLQLPKGQVEEAETRLFSEVHSKSIRGSRHKLQ